MAYIKYSAQFNDEWGRTTFVNILQKQNPLGITQLTLAANPVTITWNAESEDDPFAPMVSSKATIRFALTEDNIKFFEDVASLQEDQYGVVIYTLEPGKPTYYWDGWLIPDEQVRNFSYFNQDIELTAIDPIAKLKGKKLMDSEGRYLNGKTSLHDIVEACFAGVYESDNTDQDFNLYVKSNLYLDVTSITALPDILSQLAVSAETFNDDMGRPITCYEVVEAIATSLFMRVFYDNGTVHFVDMHELIHDENTPNREAYIKGSPLENENGLMLIDNSENIQTTRIFRESSAKFEYKGYSNLLVNGNFSRWDEIGGGYKLSDWEYNPTLLAQPDVYGRRYGNGRIEQPYNIHIKSHGSDNLFDREYEGIGGHAETPINALDELTFDIKFKIGSDFSDFSSVLRSSGGIESYFHVSMVIYNREFPQYSLVRRPFETGAVEPVWVIIDLTGTSFATGSIDWSLMAFVMDPPVGRMTGRIEDTLDVQTISFEIPPVPLIGDMGEADLFFVVWPLQSKFTWDSWAAPTDVQIYEVLLKKTNSISKIKQSTKGEVVYISRNVKTSVPNVNRTTLLNTTAKVGVSGSLFTAVEYEKLGGEIVDVGTQVKTLALWGSHLPYPFLGNSLIWYLAVMRMTFNYAQYQIQAKARGKYGGVYDTLTFDSLVDEARSSTLIYAEKYILTRLVWDVRSGEKDFTAISMKENFRPPAKEQLDDENDLSEEYYIT